MDKRLLSKDIATFWDNHIIPTMFKYIEIPNKSPSFDHNWKANGHMDEALLLAKTWIRKHMPNNAKLIIKETPGRTPFLLVDIPGERKGNVLMYGHLDKQPEMTGWDSGSGPWTPILKDDKLYGRGSADDGYALFSSICAINSVQKQGGLLPRILIMIEFSEESGSPDLPHYIKHYAKMIKEPDLVICLDSGAGDYKRFWSTTSLRGMVGCSLRVDILNEGVHSGGASGYVPSSFRIIRELLSRLENESTGDILIKDLHTTIPEHRKEEAQELVRVLGGRAINEFPWVNKAEPTTEDLVDGVLRRTWMPALSVIGADGLPPSKSAGNVLRPFTELKLSIRIPPQVDHVKAQRLIEKTLTSHPPYNSKVSINFSKPAPGWNAPKTSPWLKRSIKEASMNYFEKPDCSISEGGTIPLMPALSKMFPSAQFVITGVLGPESNAHGPNEFLHIPYVKKLTCCVASILYNFEQG